MAKSFNESISDLSNEFHELSELIRDIGDKKLKSLFKSKGYTEAAKSVAAVNKYESAIGILRRAEDVREAKLAMRRKPDRWASPSEYLEWRDIRKRQKNLGLEYVQGQKRAFAAYSLNRSGVIPSLLRNSISKYGARGGKQAFQDAVNDRLLQISDPTAYAYEQEKRIYGTENAQKFQEAREEKERRRNHYDYLRKQASERRAERKERKENRYNYLRKQASERRDLYDKAPWAKALVKSGVIDQKYIPDISKKINKLSRMPLLGGAMMLASKHPFLAGIAGLLAIANKSAHANIELTSIEQGPRAFGPVNDLFRSMAFKTGLKEEQVQKEWYTLVGKYGPAALQMLSAASKAMAGKGQLERIKIAEAFGLSPQLVNVADMIEGAEPSRAGTIASNLAKMEKIEAAGYASKNPIRHLRSWGLSLFKNVGATQGVITERNEAFPSLSGGLGNAIWQFLFGDIDKSAKEIDDAISTVNRAQTAAESAVRYDSQGLASNITTNNNTGGTVTINQVIYASGNAQEIAEKVGDETQDAVNRQRVMDAITTGDKQ